MRLQTTLCSPSAPARSNTPLPMSPDRQPLPPIQPPSTRMRMVTVLAAAIPLALFRAAAQQPAPINPYDAQLIASDPSLKRAVTIYSDKHPPATPKLAQLPLQTSVLQY